MCKLGDIIVINKYIGDDGKEITKHSFIVINDKPEFIEGFEYDFVANAMSSFKSEEQRMQKLSLEENLEVVSNDIISNIPKNNKNGYVKANQLTYFDKSKINYYILGHITDELKEELILLIIALNQKNKLVNNINNLQKEIHN